MKITFVGCDETPEQYRSRVGYVLDWWEPGPNDPRPAPGYRGQLMGIPGVLIDSEHWEIRPVDMRTEEEKWLDEADELLLLAQEPPAGDRLDVVPTRALRAQLLILRAQSRMTRRMRWTS